MNKAGHTFTNEERARGHSTFLSNVFSKLTNEPQTVTQICEGKRMAVTVQILIRLANLGEAEQVVMGKKKSQLVWGWRRKQRP